jgi:hypothetical protein
MYIRRKGNVPLCSYIVINISASFPPTTVALTIIIYCYSILSDSVRFVRDINFEDVSGIVRKREFVIFDFVIFDFVILISKLLITCQAIEVGQWNSRKLMYSKKTEPF